MAGGWWSEQHGLAAAELLKVEQLVVGPFALSFWIFCHHTGGHFGSIPLTLNGVSRRNFDRLKAFCIEFRHILRKVLLVQRNFNAFDKHQTAGRTSIAIDAKLQGCRRNRCPWQLGFSSPRQHHCSARASTRTALLTVPVSTWCRLKMLVRSRTESETSRSTLDGSSAFDCGIGSKGAFTKSSNCSRNLKFLGLLSASVWTGSRTLTSSWRCCPASDSAQTLPSQSAPCTRGEVGTSNVVVLANSLETL